MSPESSVRLVYVHDPMCSWCWGFSKVYAQLTEALPESVPVVRLLGGLAPDSSEPMPLEMQQFIQQAWKKIEQSIPGTRFNFDFWSQCQPRRSTWPACRAVIAARQQGPEYDLAMTTAIQHGYYLNAKNPSDDSALVEFAVGLGLEKEGFASTLNSAATRQRFAQEMQLAGQLGVQSYPSLVLLQGDAIKQIQINYADVEMMLSQIASAYL